MNTQTKIDKYQDVIDSRDVIERIEELTDEISTCPHCGEGILDTDSVCDDCEQPIELNEERAELKALTELASEASDYAADWEYGETLIRDSYFTEYIMELLKDCGSLPDIPWYIAIDEEQTARNCQVDYTSVDYDGITYWIR